MANRVTVTEVRQLYAFDTAIVDADATIFINAAHILTDRVNTVGGMTDAAQLKEIERWLSAHLIAIRDPQAASEKADVVSQNFQYRVDLNLNQTRYGQMAIILDTTGTLAKLNKMASTGKGTTVSLNARGPVSDSEIRDRGLPINND